MKVGVLALQGGFKSHLEKLSQLGVTGVAVRSSDELLSCDGLILPGGESTTMRRLLVEEKMLPALHSFAALHPVFGTCAGMILLSQEGILKVAVERNAYGRQNASFVTTLSILLDQEPISQEALFIRAPRIKATLSSEVETLASYQGTPVLVKQGMHLGCAFHPELTTGTAIHQFFLRSF